MVQHIWSIWKASRRLSCIIVINNLQTIWSLGGYRERVFTVQCNSMITQATLVVFTVSEACLDQGNGQGLTASHTISLLWSISRNIILHENDVLRWTATAVIWSQSWEQISNVNCFFISKNLSHCFKLIDCVYRVRLFKVKMFWWEIIIHQQQ